MHAYIVVSLLTGARTEELRAAIRPVPDSTASHQGWARCRKGRSAGSVGPPESSRDRLTRRRRYSLGYSGCLPGRQLIAGALNQLFPRRATIVRTITRACERPVWQPNRPVTSAGVLESG